MGNLTSTLSVKLLDDVSGPAGRAAGALRGLGASGDSLKRLAAASPEAARLVKQLEALRAKAAQLGEFKAANSGLVATGRQYRTAGMEADKAARSLIAAQRRVDFFQRSKASGSANYPAFKAAGMIEAADKGLRAAKRRNVEAQRLVASTQAAHGEQKRVVGALGSGLASAGISIKSLGAAEASIASSIGQVNAGLARQEALMGRVNARAAETARLAPARLKAAVQAGRAAKAEREASVASRRAASGDMVRGMGASGRVASAGIGANRRLIDGMGAPSRSARATHAEAERVAAEAGAERKAETRAGRQALAGVAGIAVAHKVKEGTHATLETYREFDNERRFGRAVMGLTDEQQKPLVDQAIHMGASTRYNDVQVLESQRELAARGLKKDQVMGLMEPAADLGQSLDLSLPGAVKQMEGALFGFKKPMATLEQAMASARQTADVQVKAAKISGMTPEDISQAYKYGATPARMSGVSEENLLAFAGISKKANMGGDESGVAFRALIAAAQSPTRKGKEAMLANGLDYKNYQRNPDKIDTAAFSKTVSAQYGVTLDKKTTAEIDKIFTDKSMIASPEKFTPAVMKLLSNNLGGDDAKSKKSIAGLANRFRDASQKGVDTNAFITDLMKKLPDNLQLSNAIFGSKQGSRIATALGDPETFRHMLDELINHSDGYAGDISRQRMAGYDGAMKRFEGATKNLETALGRSLDDEGRGGFLTSLTDAAARATMALAELPQPVLAVGAAIAWAGGKVAGIAGTVALVGAAFSLKGSAAALTAAAARLGIGGTVSAVGSAAAGGASAAAAGGAGAAAGGLTAGGVATGVIIGGGVVAGAALDAMTPGTNAGVTGLLTGSESSLQQTMRVLGEERARDAGVRAAGAPASWRAGPARTLPGGAAAGKGFPSVVPKSRGAVGDFLFGQDKATVTLPQVSGLKASMTEVDSLVAATDAKLKALGTDTIAPKVDAAPLDGLGTAAESTRGKLSQLDAMSVAPKGDPSGLAAIEAVVDRLISKLSGLGASIASTKAQAASISVPSASAGGGGAPARTASVRRELANNHV